ncbi:sulfurtransferase [Leucobacter weissii]|uniref:Sulfurtransferase n=1 Tax=Leucobacter weissii TaxID=1983706 RepID=A0A939SBU5_9MICO|nr:rhodanese-like domain-containing protein [Leucobacter weissii]MBO1901708.1 sulfurtransferase [Leucobacter weissii]
MSAALVDAAGLHADIERGRAPVILDATVLRTPDGYASGRGQFRVEGRIVGARHAELLTELSDASSGLPFTLPAEEQLQRAFGALGIAPGDRVVVYDRLSGAWAARVWFLLRALGHAEVAVLDGGFAAWVRDGRPVAYGETEAPPRARYDLALDRSWFASKEQVRGYAEGAEAATLVCALRAEEFGGEAGANPRSGHIPRSVNVPYLSLLDDEGRIDRGRAGELAARLRERGEPVVLYCGGGINAAGLALALHVAGFDDVRLYDGSLSEWAADPALPLERGSGEGRLDRPPGSVVL